MQEYRSERDSIGEKNVPIEAYYGIHALRASENFRITGIRVHDEMVKGMIEVKMAAAMANKKAGALTANIADAIVIACKEMLEGKYLENFIVDAVQGGAGTSFNMNANEVIANRAIEVLGGEKGSYSIVNPNDHVNFGQSTNDAYPCAGKIAAIRLLYRALSELKNLRRVMKVKSKEFAKVIKMGRTEMQDAVPTTLGCTFSAWECALERDIDRFDLAIRALSVMNMGATAIGTGINADKKYIDYIVPTLTEVTGLPLVQADNLTDGTQNLDCFVFASGIIKSCAVTLSKIANDIRLMSSGPRTGFGEISIPSKQNGSSIMPGKINPVIPEVVSQIAYYIMGNDTTITMAAEAGQLELNAFEPIVFYSLFQSIEMLTNGVKSFCEDCVSGIAANTDRCRELVDSSLGIVTALSTYVGYQKSCEVAGEAMRTNRSIKEVALEKLQIGESKLDEILNPVSMI